MMQSLPRRCALSRLCPSDSLLALARPPVCALGSSPSTSASSATACHAVQQPRTSLQRRHAFHQQHPQHHGRRGRGLTAMHALAEEQEQQAETATPTPPQPKAKAPLVMPTPIPPTAQLADVESLFSNGALLIDKPLDWTSFDVCAKVRNSLYRFLGKLKVGHAGTLDPRATGLLIVCTGKGTKSIDTFVAMNKSYSGTIRLGEGTATYDAEAEVSELLPWEHITDEDIHKAIQTSFNGDILQVPPMYSAIKVKGQKLYHLARDGQTVEREARPITVSSFEVTRDPENRQNLHFLINCSKGTYIRSLAYDLGRALGTAAHLTALRRESIGDYSVRDAWQLHELLEQVQQARQANASQAASATEPTPAA